MNKLSGYDPATGICWQFGNKGDTRRRCTCPAHVAGYDKHTLAWFGRCKSGRDWFWAAGGDAYGWENTEELAIAAAMAAVRDGKQPDLPMIAFFHASTASYTLKKLNEAKRASRPAPDTKDSAAVAYLFGYRWGSEDHRPHIERFAITKRTAKRIYYRRNGKRVDEHGEPINYDFIYPERDTNANIGFVDRQKLEAEGYVTNHGRHWSDYDRKLYATLDGLLAKFRRDEPEQIDLSALKAEMAAAHPDKGGSSEAFVAARAAYVAARRALRSKEVS